MSCPLIRCALGFESQTPEGECCAECVPTPPPPPDPTTVDECALIPDPGPCRASLPRFYFNDTTQTCKQFTYGGCLGNDNRFCTSKDCLEACSSTTPTVPGEDNFGVCIRSVLQGIGSHIAASSQLFITSQSYTVLHEVNTA